MSQSEWYEILVLVGGSGWQAAGLAYGAFRATDCCCGAVVDRRLLSNTACLPSKNEIWSTKVAHLARRAARFGAVTGSVTIDTATVRERKRDMVESQKDLAERGRSVTRGRLRVTEQPACGYINNWHN